MNIYHLVQILLRENKKVRQYIYIGKLLERIFMNYKEFETSLLKALTNRFPDYVVKMERHSESGEKQVVVKKSENCAVGAELKQLYEGSAGNVQTIVDGYEKMIRNLDRGPSAFFDQYLNQERLVAICRNINALPLSEQVHGPVIGDMTAALFFEIGISNHVAQRIRVTPEHLEMLHMSKEEAYILGLKNHLRKYPLHIYKSLEEGAVQTNNWMSLEEFENFRKAENQRCENDVRYSVTGSGGVNIATALFDDTIMKRIEAVMPEDFFIVPLCLQCFLLTTRKKENPIDSQRVLRNLNRNSKEDTLSNYVYEYKKGKLSVLMLE